MQTTPAEIPLGAQFPVAVLGNSQTSDFELIDLGPSGPLPLSADLAFQMRSRGLYFIGTVCLDNGVPRSALEHPLDAVSVQALSAAYIRHVSVALDNALEVAELRRLHTLTDGRSH